MAERAPLHLVARLRVIEDHVFRLARDRGLEDTFAGDLAALRARSEEARERRSKDTVESVLEELRALARRIASEPRTGRRLTDPRSGVGGEHLSGLGATDE